MSPTTPSKKKNTGLGTQAFFGGSAAPESPQANAPAPSAEFTAQPAKPVREKTRTTVILYNDTLEAIELLKAQSRKQGIKASMSDILNDAVELLRQARNQQ